MGLSQVCYKFFGFNYSDANSTLPAAPGSGFQLHCNLQAPVWLLTV
jgi:hypothetical protein